jgi:hypothetical protein
MSDSLSALESERANLIQQFSQLGDFRPGSITGTGGRCGNPRCHCHREGDPGHAPHLRLTFKSGGKSVTESLPDSAAQRKAEREIAEFQRYRELSRAFVEVNAKICRLRPVQDTLTPAEKKRLPRSSKTSSKK